jgi:hypothetical protein
VYPTRRVVTGGEGSGGGGAVVKRGAVRLPEGERERERERDRERDAVKRIWEIDRRGERERRSNPR